jgi:hypothetical protein
LEGFYARTLAALALEQKAPQLALEFLHYVEDEPESESQSLQLQAIAFLMLGNAAALDMVLDYLKEDDEYAAIQKALWVTNINELNKDSEKYYYVILRGLSMPLFEMKENISRFEDKEIATQALKYLVDLNLHNYRPEQASEYLELLRPKLSPEDRFFMNASLKILYQQNELERLFSNLENLDREGIHSQDYLLYSALADAHNHNPEEAAPKFRKLAFSNPFFEAGIIESAEFFSGFEDEWLSYNILLQAIRFNKYSVKLHQAYILHALRLGLGDYAQDALHQLENLMDAVAYSEFKNRFDSLKKSISPEW